DPATGTVYLFYYHDDNTIWYARSTDAGETWTNAAIATTVPPTASDACHNGYPAFRFGSEGIGVPVDIYPRAAINDRGLIRVAWNDGRGGSSDIYNVFSSDRGATWSAPAQISAPSSAQEFMPSVVAVGHNFYFQWYTGQPQ